VTVSRFSILVVSSSNDASSEDVWVALSEALLRRSCGGEIGPDLNMWIGDGSESVCDVK
jgi:hypothetical protein